MVTISYFLVLVLNSSSINCPLSSSNGSKKPDNIILAPVKSSLHTLIAVFPNSTSKLFVMVKDCLEWSQ